MISSLHFLTFVTISPSELEQIRITEVITTFLFTLQIISYVCMSMIYIYIPQKEKNRLLLHSSLHNTTEIF